MMVCPLLLSAQEDTPEVEHIIVHPNDDDDWLYGFHDTISDSVFGTAKWFDSFFGADEIEEVGVESLARIQLGWEPRARDFDVFSQRFRVRVKLPNLKNKVDLIFSDDLDDESINKQFSEARSPQSDHKEDSFSAAIRVINADKLSKFIDTRLGITGGDVFVKTRYKWDKVYNDKHHFEVQPSLYYYLDEGLGSKLFLEYEYGLAADKQLRTSYSVKVSESFSGNKWRHGFYYLHQLDHLRATSLGVVIKGEDNSEKGYNVENYTLSYRYRINAYRKWLFFEIEPFFEWPEDEDYKFTPGIALRVEGFFKRSE
ncbi:hypothetical protein [Thalassotalea aquiviva]|uniref:hypothetical protein n=1 Tax=Thalassotalea aquiviva TaxID=3242415 RepID=UPI00352AF806